MIGGGSLNAGKLEFKRTFSLEELVNDLLVRGTISFYNQRLQFFLLEKVRYGMHQM